MRFMVMHKGTAEMETGLPPDQTIIDGVGQLIGQAAKEGLFVGGAGLRPTAERVHLAYRGGTRTTTEGPFREARELVSAFAMVRVTTREEALRFCDRLAAALGDVEIFLGPVVERWHLGMGERPADAPLRFLALVSDPHDGARAPREGAAEAVAALLEETTQARVLEASGRLAPTREGARIHFEGGKRTVLDGPFAESKELVAGYSLLELPSRAAAVEWALRFGEVVRVHEIDVRALAA